MYDQARKLQLSFVELHSRAEALLRAGAPCVCVCVRVCVRMRVWCVCGYLW